MMDTMDMIGHLTVYTVQEISAEDRRGSGLGALHTIVGLDGWMWLLHICLISGVRAACVTIPLATERCNLMSLLSLL
jgi:hypothetical protein